MSNYHHPNSYRIREKELSGTYRHSPHQNIDRLEWFLEKAVEAGIDEITPILCVHSERTVIKPERLEKIMISAMKQSLKTYLPVLNPMISFPSAVSIPFHGVKMIGYCGEEHRKHISEVYTPSQDAFMLIGPEGDFSSQEIELALSKGFNPVSLGESRLRTETAGLASVFYIHFANMGEKKL